VVKTRGIVLVSVHGVFQAIVVVLEPCPQNGVAQFTVWSGTVALLDPLVRPVL
jgi:hypothetical protein